MFSASAAHVERAQASDWRSLIARAYTEAAHQAGRRHLPMGQFGGAWARALSTVTGIAAVRRSAMESGARIREANWRAAMIMTDMEQRTTGPAQDAAGRAWRYVVGERCCRER